MGRMTSHSSLTEKVLMFALLSCIIINSISFYSQECSDLGDKFVVTQLCGPQQLWAFILPDLKPRDGRGSCFSAVLTEVPALSLTGPA